MQLKTRTLSCFVVALAVFTWGCQNNDESSTKKPNEEHSHSHGDADKLVWVKKDIKIGDYLVTLGHHGDHFHPGDSIEPAVMITKDGKDISNAKIQNDLVGSNNSGDTSNKQPLKYEPKTDEEPAHYAQGDLVIPKNTDKIKIQFYITLPGESEEHVHAIDVDVAQH